MEPTTLALFILGLFLLVAGAEFLVRGASGLAVAAGISKLVIGLTVVAYGTSAPELAVSVRSAWVGEADIALGNVVGSNIFNVLFILGISALLVPLAVAKQLVRVDVPILIFASGLAYGWALDGRIDRFEGGLFLCGGFFYTILAIWMGRRGEAAPPERGPRETSSGPGARRESNTPVALVLVAVGLTMLVLGARWLVDGAVAIAVGLGMSELTVGLTIVAAGTSLPEVATSIVAAVRGERDIAVGNVVGSSIFNILVVLGAAAAIPEEGVQVSSKAISLDLPVMLAVAALSLPIFFTGWRIGRFEGFSLLAAYVAYTAYLVLDAKGQVPAGYSTVLFYVVFPVTAVVLAAQVVHSIGLSARPAREENPR